MRPLVDGFTNELVKLSAVSPEAARTLKRLGVEAGLMGGVHGVINPHAHFSDMARAGVGLAGGGHLGSMAARAARAGKWGRVGASLGGALAGAKLLQKKRKRRKD